MADYNEQAAHKVVEEISAFGGAAAAIKSDVSKLGDIRQTIRFARERFGRLDFLHNNAFAFPRSVSLAVRMADTTEWPPRNSRKLRLSRRNRNALDRVSARA